MEWAKEQYWIGLFSGNRLDGMVFLDGLNDTLPNLKRTYPFFRSFIGPYTTRDEARKIMLEILLVKEKEV